MHGSKDPKGRDYPAHQPYTLPNYLEEVTASPSCPTARSLGVHKHLFRNIGILKNHFINKPETSDSLDQSCLLFPENQPSLKFNPQLELHLNELSN